MKKTVLLAFSALGLLAILTAGTQSDNGKAGAVGSAGEVYCTNCHSTYSIGSGAGTIELRTGIANNQYTPGQSYPMVFKVAYSGRSLFGMGLEALNASNTNAGTLTGDATHTTTKSATIGTTSRKSVTHTFNGGASADSMLFHFTWVAPAAGTGNVTMYYCGACCNANASDAGDYIYRGTTVLTEASTAGIATVQNNLGVEVLPNPVHDRCSIQLNGTITGTASIRLFDMTGQLVKEEQLEKTSSGSQLNWEGLSSLPRGTYLLNVSTDVSNCVKRIVLQ